MWNPFKRKTNEPKLGPVEMHDLGDDPLDPRGDGTLRPDDPLGALLAESREGVIVAEQGRDGRWRVRRPAHRAENDEAKESHAQ